MAGGLAELEQWLRDQVQSGLAGTDRAGYQLFDALAARMVDAQMPAVAATVRRLAGVAVSGEGWPGRLLEEYGLLHLLARSAGPMLGAGPGIGGDGRSATLRARLGVTVAKEDVLSRPGERDAWAVLGRRDDVEERLIARRVWLRGERSGRVALVMSFAVPGQVLDASLVPGSAIEADLHFYPGAVPLRALVGARHAPARASGPVSGGSLEEALRGWAAALAGDPWLRDWPVLVEAVPVRDVAGWWLVDADGSLPLAAAEDDGWALLAASGGYPLPMLAEIVPAGIRVVTVLGPACEPAVAG
jgi:hypothetical protein